MRIPLAALLCTVLGGCDLYFGAGDDDDDCRPGLYDPTAPMRLRDPVTGTCESYGGYDPCGPTYAGTGAGAPAEVAAWPDWGYCDSYCSGLDEATCRAADGCRAVYLTRQDCAGTDCAQTLEFAGCWATAQSGPVRGGGCTALDAQACSLHDDCSAVHAPSDYDLPDEDGIGRFVSCSDEIPTCGGTEPGRPLPPLRNPETGECETIYGGDPCDPAFSDEMPMLPDWGYCDGACEGLDEATCLAADGCRPVYADACPPSADCDAPWWQFAACWSTAQSGPVRGGDCTVLDAYECSRHDDCAAFHERVWSECAGGDWTTCPVDLGSFFSCGPEEVAPPPPPLCADVFDERTCIETAGCEPIYEGSECSCTDTECTCAVWTFLACRDA